MMLAKSGENTPALDAEKPSKTGVKKVVKVTFVIDAELKRRLERYAREDGVKMRFVVEKALDEYLTRRMVF